MVAEFFLDSKLKEEINHGLKNNFFTQPMDSKKNFLEDEVFIIEDSGEMPEVALQSSLYFLCTDPDGPGLTLDDDDIQPLKKAVISRYQTIILRDLTPANRKKTIYRGLARCAINWQRMKIFAQREKLDISHVRHKTAPALIAFLKEEVCYVNRGGESSCPNCNQESLDEFARELGLSPDELPCGWKDLCCKECQEGA